MALRRRREGRTAGVLRRAREKIKAGILGRDGKTGDSGKFGGKERRQVCKNPGETRGGAEGQENAAVTREELNQLYHLQREIEGQKRRIKELRNTLKSPAMSGMPRGGGVSDPVAKTVELMERQEEMLAENLQKCLEQQNRLLEFVRSVEDSRMRQILCYRHLDGLNWVQVAHRMSVTPESVKMAYKRFFDGKEDIQ